jgi:hypothetical protein
MSSNKQFTNSYQAALLTTFDYRAKDLRSWMNSAEQLKIAADAVFEQMSLAKTDEMLMDEQVGGLIPSAGPVYVFLAGLSIENLLKGLVVHRHPEFVSAKGELTHSLGTHNLGALVSDAGLRGVCSAAEQQFLQRAEEAIPYWGRYHIPAKAEKLVSQWGWSQDDRTAFNSIYIRWGEQLLRTFVKGEQKWTVSFEETGLRQEAVMSEEEYMQWRLHRKRPARVTVTRRLTGTDDGQAQ